jgi:outer membrane protein TolC
MKKILFFLLVILFHPAYSQDIITLEEAMNIAIKNSPDILKSELNMTISRENLNASLAATKSLFKFQLTPFNYNQNRTFFAPLGKWITTQTKSISGDFVVSQPVVFTDGRITLHNELSFRDESSDLESASEFKGFSNNLYLSYSQPLFTYNKIRMQIDQLKLALENATLSYAIQRLYLERAVNQYFYMVYQRKLALTVAEDENKNQQTSYDIIKSKVEGGLSAMEEFYQAELNLTTSKSNLQNARVNLDNAKDDFKQYIGIPLNQEFDIETNIEFKEVLLDLNKAIQNGLDTRMELRQHEISIENSRDQLVVAKATNEFAGNVDLSIGLIGENEALARVYDKPTRTPQVTVGFNIPLWDWGERKSRIKATEATIESANITLEEEHNNIILGIRKVYRNLLNLQNQIEIARQSVTNAQLTYDLNLEKYKNGDLTGMDLNIYQNQLSEKQLSFTNSLISYKLELLNLKIQTLYDFEKKQAVTPKMTIDN